MKSGSFSKSEFIRGMVAAIPISVGYMPIAIAFGVIAVQSGIPPFSSASMSLMVYAGASQFMGVNMIMTGAGFAEIVLAVFVLNLRHFVMSMSVMHDLKHIKKEWKPILAFGITDETFAVLSMKEREQGNVMNPGFVAGLMATAYASWVAGTIVGGIFADYIPSSISSSMAIGLYAMFVGLLIPAVKGSWKAGIIVAASIILCTVLGNFLERGWAIVLATVIAASAGIFLLKEDQTV